MLRFRNKCPRTLFFIMNFRMISNFAEIPEIRFSFRLSTFYFQISQIIRYFLHFRYRIETIVQKNVLRGGRTKFIKQLRRTEAKNKDMK